MATGVQELKLAVQTLAGEAVPAAAERTGIEAADEAGIPLAHGGTVHHPREEAG